MSENLAEDAAAGAVYKNPNDSEPELFYTQGELVCSLTLDEKQAWIMLVLLGPWKSPPTEEEWEFVHAAYDVRRRIAEAMGVK